MTTYVVGSYRAEAQLLRLLRRLRADSPDARLVVLRDRGAAPLSAAAGGLAEVWTTPTPVTWGDASWLRAVLDALRRLAPAPGEWVVTLTEQCYPLRPLRELEAHLRATGADAMLDEFVRTDPGAAALLMRYRQRPVRLPLTGRPAVRRSLNAVSRRLGRSGQGREGVPVSLRLPRLRTPFGPGLAPRAGSDWWALSGRAVAALLDPSHDALLRYFAHTVVPSEGYVCTVLLNDPAIANAAEALHYLQFDGSPHPRTLTLDDLPAAYASGAWFARKLDDGPVLDELDRHLAAL